MFNGIIDQFKGEYSFLSNFYPVTVPYEGEYYPSVEHAFQAAKTLNLTSRREIAQAATAGAAKKLGQTVELRRDWDFIKLSVMLGLTRTKYSVPELRKLLTDTDGYELVEGNTWHDRYWGVCLCRAGTGWVNDAHRLCHRDMALFFSRTPTGDALGISGRGVNWLGRILECVRAEVS